MVISASNARAFTPNVSHEDRAIKSMKATINLKPIRGLLSLGVLLSVALRGHLAQCVSAIEVDTENLNAK